MRATVTCSIAGMRHEQRAIASATKLMTALVAIEELPLERRVRAVAYAAGPAESRIDLRAGERMSVADLLRALLLESANDAANTLAVRASGSVDAFVARMNREAREMGLERTRFANPIGLDDPGNHSSALDLARVARRVLRNDFLAATVDMPRARLTTGARTRIVVNRNRLVAREPSIDGVKTGHTQLAGYVLVGAATRKGARLVSVVLGEPTEAARDSDTLALLRYGFTLYRRAPVARAGATLARSKVEHFGDRETPLVAARRVSVTVRRGERVRTVVEAPGTLGGPIAEGARVGTLRVYRGERLVRSVAARDGRGGAEGGSAAPDMELRGAGRDGRGGRRNLACRAPATGWKRSMCAARPGRTEPETPGSHACARRACIGIAL